MEASELVLAPDGTGWSRLTNAAGADDTTRLTWSCPRPGLLVLRETSLAEGGGPSVPADGTLETGYRLGEEDGRTVLELEQPVEFTCRYTRTGDARRP
ncbi:hypothetical protein FM076_23740 [Streptomyces albus subsp. chlorinus]|uniref:hypothetical protein n=1 Tax=Streptomyces albus TaxID=1888 RepID=UPI00156EDC00|nr:hypothetical protein [Streptomyces albus]NSC23998.1 hypothetical protein [Streptomyces albus subsp. chlorinus]